MRDLTLLAGVALVLAYWLPIMVPVAGGLLIAATLVSARGIG